MISTNIIDKAKKFAAHVLSSGALLVQLEDNLQAGAEKISIFNSFLTDDGTDAGSSDMAVNGATTSQDFYIKPPSTDKDLYISTVLFTIADAGAALNQFGAIAALANGCDFFYENDTGTKTIRNSLKSNFQFGEMVGFTPAFGSANNAFRANNVQGTSEGFLFEYDFKRKNGFERGLVLKGGTNQRLVLRVNDNIAGIDLFTAYFAGFERTIVQ